MFYQPTRRRVLGAFIGGLTGLSVSAERSSSAPAPSRGPPVIDTHVHCFAGPADPRFPYHADAPYRPEHAATPEDLLRCMDGAGVAGAVIVHPEPYQDDHRYLRHCLAVGGDRFRATVLLYADRAGTGEQLAELTQLAAVKAIRIHAYAPERLAPLDTPAMRTLWKSATDRGLMMQIHFEPRYAAGFEPLLSEFKTTTVLIDHLGRPFQGSTEEHQRVLGWAEKFPQTVMKMSAVPDRRNYPHRDPAPVIRELLEAFGPDRIMWGGGFTAGVTADTYRRERQRVADLLPAGLGDADRAKIFGATAARRFGFTGG